MMMEEGQAEQTDTWGAAEHAVGRLLEGGMSAHMPESEGKPTSPYATKQRCRRVSKAEIKSSRLFCRRRRWMNKKQRGAFTKNEFSVEFLQRGGRMQAESAVRWGDGGGR